MMSGLEVRNANLSKYLELSDKISFSFTKYFARTVQFKSILAKISTIGLEEFVLDGRTSFEINNFFFEISKLTRQGKTCLGNCNPSSLSYFDVLLLCC